MYCQSAFTGTKELSRLVKDSLLLHLIGFLPAGDRDVDCSHAIKRYSSEPLAPET